MLGELLKRLEQKQMASPGPSATPKPEKSSLQKVEVLLERFHAMGVEFRKRHADRPVFDIEDEYDVQDLLRAFLKLWFDDVRPEEWTPSYAGGSSRMDFLLKSEQLVVEVKKTRKGLAAKEVGEQLLIDIGKYGAHPDCKTLVCFVYDPENRIHNPAAIEGDLSGMKGEMMVKVLVRPRP